MLKLPSSLKWLLEKRGRIDGSIQKIERYLAEHQRVFEKYQELSTELSFLKETLASVDTALRLHKLEINPQDIPPISGKNYLTDMPRGELTFLILERIRMSSGQPVSSSEIIDFIITSRQVAGIPAIPRASLSPMVRRRLNGLFHKGELVRHHPQRTQSCGCWTLSSDITQDTRNKVDDLAHIS
ncbi:hypothetical protein D3C87_291910 [compost metagenome]